MLKKKNSINVFFTYSLYSVLIFIPMRGEVVINNSALPSNEQKGVY